MSKQWMGNLILFDRSEEVQDDVWYSFAVDELLSEQVAKHNTMICHVWTHQAAVILGQRDARLPYVKEALAQLETNGYRTCVRHSGGAAVPLDKNVLNITLIFPLGAISEQSYHDGFEKMYELIANVCATMPYTISKGEIAGAYCPGDYDLSVNGLKFCGIAQRRKVNAYMVQAFINIDGDSVQRATLIKQFYDLAVKEKTDSDYPNILPQTLSSLAQFGSFILDDERKHSMSEVKAFVDRLASSIDGTRQSKAEDLYISLPQHEAVILKADQLRRRYRIV